MKNFKGSRYAFGPLLFALAFVVGTSSAFAFEPLLQPDLAVNSTATYKEVNFYTGEKKDLFTLKIVAKSKSGYAIIEEKRGKTDRYDVSRHLGRTTPVRGNYGNGNQFDFPLTDGKPWTYISFIVNKHGHTQKEVRNCRVKGKEILTIDTVKHETVRVVCNGDWENLDMSTGGSLGTIMYYSPTIGLPVQLENTYNFRDGGQPSRNIHVLGSFSDPSQ